MQTWRPQFPEKIGVLGVIPGIPSLVSQLAIQDKLRVPLLCDPEYQFHEWLGLGRFQLIEFFKPKTLAGYIKGLFKGRLISPSGKDGDLFRQGGEVLLAKNGKTMWVYRSENPTDRPQLTNLTQAFKQLKS